MTSYWFTLCIKLTYHETQISVEEHSKILKNNLRKYYIFIAIVRTLDEYISAKNYTSFKDSYILIKSYNEHQLLAKMSINDQNKFPVKRQNQVRAKMCCTCYDHFCAILN